MEELTLAINELILEFLLRGVPRYLEEVYVALEQRAEDQARQSSLLRLCPPSEVD